MAEGRDVDEVGVSRIDEDAPDLLRVAQADVRPGPPAVGGLVHPVALRDVGAHVGFAGADVDHLRVRGGEGQCAPIEPIGCASKIGFQVRPASFVSHTPPLTLPK